MNGLSNEANYANANDYAGFQTVELASQTADMADDAFLHLPNIEHIVLHSGCTKHNAKAFTTLANLQTIDVSDGQSDTYSSDNVVLFDHDGTTLLYYPTKNETADRPWHLNGTALKGVGCYALYHCPIVHEVAFGSQLASIDEHALDGSAIDRVTFDLTTTTPLSICNYAFANMTEPYLRYFKFPVTLSALGHHAFYADRQLEAVELYDSQLTAIGDSTSGAFYTVSNKEWNEVATRQGHRCHMQLPTATASLVKAFVFSRNDETTGITTVSQEATDNKWYNLSGQRISRPSKGIYINNGKKIVIK